jgi:PHP family Zn ribbon phosphoesterase
VGASSKAVDKEYRKLLHNLGNEFKILMDVPLDDIESAGTPLIREAVSRVRSGNVHITPGFDGEYGKVKIFEETERKKIKGKMSLF